METLKATLLAEPAYGNSLAQSFEEPQRHRIGRRAETLPLDQLELELEDVQQAEAAEKEKAEPAAGSVAAKRRRVKSPL